MLFLMRFPMLFVVYYLKEKTMALRPTYEELEQRVRDLESETIKQKQIECELYEWQEQFRLYFTWANDVMFSIDPQFKIMSITPNVQKILGYTPEHFIGRPLYELNVMASEYLEKAFANVTHLLSKGTIDATIYQVIAKDGTRRFAEVNSVPLVRGNKTVAVISVARDITVHLEMQQALRESEERFRAIFDSAEDCIFIKDANLNYTVVNPCMEELFGLSSNDIMALGASLGCAAPATVTVIVFDAVSSVLSSAMIRSSTL